MVLDHDDSCLVKGHGTKKRGPLFSGTSNVFRDGPPYDGRCVPDPEINQGGRRTSLGYRDGSGPCPSSLGNEEALGHASNYGIRTTERQEVLHHRRRQGPSLKTSDIEEFQQPKTSESDTPRNAESSVSGARRPPVPWKKRDFPHHAGEKVHVLQMSNY